MNKYQELAVRALGNMMGDDTARARAAFRNLIGCWKLAHNKK